MPIHTLEPIRNFKKRFNSKKFTSNLNYRKSVREVIEDAAKQHGREDLMKTNVNQAKQTKALLKWAKDGFPDLNSNNCEANDYTDDANNNKEETADKVMEHSKTWDVIKDSSLGVEEDAINEELVNGGQSGATESVETIEVESYEKELGKDDSVMKSDESDKGE